MTKGTIPSFLKDLKNIYCVPVLLPFVFTILMNYWKMADLAESRIKLLIFGHSLNWQHIHPYIYYILLYLHIHFFISLTSSTHSNHIWLSHISPPCCQIQLTQFQFSLSNIFTGNICYLPLILDLILTTVIHLLFLFTSQATPFPFYCSFCSQTWKYIGSFVLDATIFLLS